MPEQTKKRGRPTKEQSVRNRYELSTTDKPKQKRPNRSANMKVQTKPGEMSQMITHAVNLQNMARWRIDKNNPEEMQGRVNEYLTYCIENNMRPTVESMALAFGVDRSTLRRWKDGESDLIEPCRRIIENGYNMMNQIMTQCLVDGKINPVAAFFLMKNNFSYRDQTETVVTVNNPYTEQNADDVKSRYLNSMENALPADGSVE